MHARRCVSQADWLPLSGGKKRPSPCKPDEKQTDRHNSPALKCFFATTNCDVRCSCTQDINSTGYPGLKVIIWMPCEGHSLTEEWSVDTEPIDRLANKPRVQPVNPQVSQASPTSTPPTIHVLIPPTASCYHHWLHNNLHWLSLGGLNHPWMMDEFAGWVDSFSCFNRQTSEGDWLTQRRGLLHGNHFRVAELNANDKGTRKWTLAVFSCKAWTTRKEMC